MDVNVDLIAASCNLSYNCLELGSGTLIFGSNYALAVYNLQKKKVVKTYVKHTATINCVRFLKQSRVQDKWILSAGADGQVIIWENHHQKGYVPHEETECKLQELTFELEPRICHHPSARTPIVVCDGIMRGNQENSIIGYITTLSQVFVVSVDLTGGGISIIQELNLNQSVALDLILDVIGENDLIMGLGMDTGELTLFRFVHTDNHELPQLFKMCALKKHEDWVRCLAVTTLENGDKLLASGGQDSFIAIWRFKTMEDETSTNEFEFQVIEFQNYKIVFDSMIIGHEGWINSLQWNRKGELISCSSDQTVIIWESVGDIWTEKVRLGVVGGQIPGGFCVRFNEDVVVTSGFQGAIQIWSWSQETEEWVIEPSVTGHFNSVSDLDYHPQGHYLVTTSEDQTTRVFSPWGQNRWHEISRPQIHGHDIFTLKCSGDFIVSGAEEKILRVFQPTEIFVKNYEDATSSSLVLSNVAQAASLPALGLSNQNETTDLGIRDIRIEERLEDDFLRSQTLWPEVSKLYGHGYEICTIGASPKDPIIASGCNSSKPQFSTIILWCTRSWKNLGEFSFHKLNVTNLEFSADGSRLLSVSRDRTWALWKVILVEGEGSNFSLELIESGGFHTRAISVGTWSPTGRFFVTGGRDKKMVIWKSPESTEMMKFEKTHVELFQNSVSAAAVNESSLIAVGLETGLIFIFTFNENETDDTRSLQCLAKLDNSLAHHDIVRRLKFNPREKCQLASGSADHLVKVYQLYPM